MRRSHILITSTTTKKKSRWKGSFFVKHIAGWKWNLISGGNLQRVKGFANPSQKIGALFGSIILMFTLSHRRELNLVTQDVNIGARTASKWKVNLATVSNSALFPGTCYCPFGFDVPLGTEPTESFSEQLKRRRWQEKRKKNHLLLLCALLFEKNVSRNQLLVQHTNRFSVS